VSDSAIITFALVAAVTGIAYGLYLAMWVFKLDAGNPKMQEIAKAIQEGASAYLNRQYRTVGVVAAVLFTILWGAGAISDKFGLLTAIGFLIGAGASSLAGYVGMVIAVRANVRTAQAAHKGMNAALTVAFRGGAVTGLLLIGLGLLAITTFYTVASQFAGQEKAIHALLSLGFGGSLISVFARVGEVSIRKRRMLAQISSGKSKRGFRRTTLATQPSSRTTWATMSATAPVWPRTFSRPMR